MNRKNPYAYLRERTGMTQTAFAAKHGLARQTLVAIEQGVYPSLSDRMIVELGKECHVAGVDARTELMTEYGVATLSEAYANWRNADRADAADRLSQIAPTMWGKRLSPMHYVVKEFGRGVQGFSKALKIPSSTLLRYIKGEQREMPRSIEEALRAIHYPFLTDLIQRQADWVDEHRAV